MNAVACDATTHYEIAAAGNYVLVAIAISFLKVRLISASCKIDFENFPSQQSSLPATRILALARTIGHCKHFN